MQKSQLLHTVSKFHGRKVIKMKTNSAKVYFTHFSMILLEYMEIWAQTLYNELFAQ